VVLGWVGVVLVVSMVLFDGWRTALRGCRTSTDKYKARLLYGSFVREQRLMSMLVSEDKGMDGLD
jgi:hypothetical protein